MNTKFLLSAVLLCLVSSASVAARDVQQRPQTSRATTFGSTSTVTTPVAQQQLSAEERITKLERILDNQGLVEMFVRLDSLQQELQALRGQIEVQNHIIQDLKQRQRDLYEDIDRRLVNMERNGGAVASRPPPAVNNTVVDKPQTATTAPAVADKPVASTASKPATAQDIASEQKAYQQAFDLLRELRYEQAVTSFRQFIARFPNGRYAHIAQYWIGEANYAQRQFEEAIKDYTRLIEQYPNSPKLAEAMLKIGYSYYELKDMVQAQTQLEQLIKKYPGTTESGQAQNLLQKIRLSRAG